MANDVIDDHLDRFAPEQRAALERTCETIRATLPGAAPELKYGMPTFTIDGVAVVGVEGFRNHNSLFPYSGSIVTALAADLANFTTSKGTVQFPRSDPFPAPPLRRILKARIQEINDSYPKASGVTKEFYDNGFLKAKGKIRGDRMSGDWQWFRRDGTLKRSGSFRAGERVGEWTTYDAEGAPYRVTHY